MPVERRLRQWHRRLALITAPLLLLQTFSGALLSFDWIAGVHQKVGSVIYSTAPFLPHDLDNTLIDLHYASGSGGAVYRLLVVVTVFLLLSTGSVILLLLYRRNRAAARSAATGHPPDSSPASGPFA